MATAKKFVILNNMSALVVVFISTYIALSLTINIYK